MPLETFKRLTFAQADAVVTAHNAREEAREKAAWERTRTLACLLLHPHLKKGKRLTPRETLPLPWDNEGLRAEREERREKREEAPAMSYDEKQKLLAELAKAEGMKMG